MLVALVAQGPIVALFMLAGVIAVQQLEAHVLQPFLLGRMVSVHPLGVIVAVACGVYLAGIAGALVAVPLVAAANTIAPRLATYAGVRDEADEHSSTTSPTDGIPPDAVPDNDHPVAEDHEAENSPTSSPTSQPNP